MYYLSTTDIERWIGEMKKSDRASSDADCARLLGMSTTGFWKMKTKGADFRTALAFTAVLNGQQPYQPERG